MNSSGLKIVEPTDLPDVVCGYKRKEFLGAGSFGYVYKGQHEVTEGLVAIKFIDRRKIYEEQSEFIRQKRLRLLRDEGTLMRLCQSEHVVRCHNVVSLDNYEVMILEYCDGSNLQKYIRSKPNRRLDVAEAIEILQQIVEGFAELHRRNIIHRDMKSENVFSGQDKFKIGDMGLARIMESLSEQSRMTILGTRETMAPEVFNGKYGVKADMWSLGAIFFEMLHGYSPFEGATNKISQRIRICKGEYEIDEQLIGNKEVVVLLEKMLTVDQNQRINWSELHSHPLMMKLPQSRIRYHFYNSLEGSERHRSILEQFQQLKQQDKSNAQIELLRQIEQQYEPLVRQYVQEIKFETNRVQLIIRNGVEIFLTESISIPDHKYAQLSLLLASRCLLHIMRFKLKHEEAMNDIYPAVAGEYLKLNDLLVKIQEYRKRLLKKLNEQRSRSAFVLGVKNIIGLADQPKEYLEDLSLTKYSLAEQMDYTLDIAYPPIRQMLLKRPVISETEFKFLKFMQEYLSISVSEYPADCQYFSLRLPRLLQ